MDDYTFQPLRNKYFHFYNLKLAIKECQIKLFDCKMNETKLIELPKMVDPRGNLSFIQSGSQVPFTIERTYWIYDVPGGEMRGGHAFYEMQEFIVALSGSFDVVLDDGVSKNIISLNRSYRGVYIPKMIWRSLENFSTNSLALVLSDQPYNVNDYIRDYDLYLKLKSENQ